MKSAPSRPDQCLAVKYRSGGREADRESGQEHDRGGEDNADDGDDHVGDPLVQEVLRPGPQFSGEDELRGADFLQADAAAHALVGIGGLFDHVSSEAQIEQFGHGHTVAPFEHAHDNAVWLGGADDLVERAHGAERFAAGKRGGGLVAVDHIAGDFEAGLRMFGDIPADVFEQRAAAHQQQAIPADYLQRESAKHDPPEEDG